MARTKTAFQNIWDRHQGFCFWCDCFTVRWHYRNGKIPRNAATIDHVVPRSKGGSNGQDNLILACHACNNERGNMDAEEYLLFRHTSQAA